MAVRTIGTDIKLTGEKEFNDGMKAINSNLKTLRSDMAATSATFEENAGSVEALTSKQKILQESVEQQRVKVDALRQMYEKVAAASGENSAAADKWKQQLNNATVALIREEAALRKNNDALNEARASAAKAENAVEDLSDASAETARSVDKAADELEDLNKQADKSGSILPGVAQGLGTVASGAAQAGAAVLAVGAALGTAAITAMVSFAHESAEAAKAAADAGETLTESQQIWLGYAEKLGALDAAAANAKRALGGVLLPQLSELSTEGSVFLNNFAQSMEEAAGDSKAQAEVMSQYIVEGVRLLTGHFPEYIRVGKDLLGGLKQGFLEAAPELADEGVGLVFDLLDSILDSADELSEGGEVLFEKLKTGLEDRGPDLISSAVSLLSSLITGLASHAVDLIPVAGSLIITLVSGLAASLPEIGTAAGQIIGELIAYLLSEDALVSVANAAIGIGEAIAKAIWNALVSMFKSIADIPGLLEGLKIGFNFTNNGTVSPIPVPELDVGMDYVPYDEFPALLHKGEMVLTAAEADRYRNGRTNGSGRPAANVSLTFNVQKLSEEDVEMVLDLVDRKLGDDM